MTSSFVARSCGRQNRRFKARKLPGSNHQGRSGAHQVVAVLLFVQIAGHVPELDPDLCPPLVERLTRLEQEGDTVPPAVVSSLLARAFVSAVDGVPVSVTSGPRLALLMKRDIAAKVGVIELCGTVGSSRYPGSRVPSLVTRLRYWPRTTLSFWIGWIDRITLT